MIKYSLGCNKNHEFEGWFASSEEFLRLRDGKLLDCPVCGSIKIDKLLMAPSVKSTKGKDITDIAVAKTGANVPVSGLPVAPTQMQAVAGPPMSAIPAEVQQEVIRHLREIRKQVLANAEDVGENFGNEARKIHYGESEQRGIYGQTSPEEAVELIEEGINVVPLPVLPEDKN